jgi:hypothetical protein
MPRVALYDRNRKPPSWMDLIRPGQYAAFFRDIDTGAEVTEAGVPLCSGESPSCVIFDSFPEASDYCQRKVSQVSALRCDVFDSQGRVNAPVASFVNRAHSHKLDSPEKFRRMILIGFVPIAVSLPLFWFTWSRGADTWLAAFFGVQLVLLGLRLLYWGYSMREEIENRRKQSELRAQRAATDLSRSADVPRA